MGHFQASSALSASLLSDVFSYKLPILIEAGYDITPNLMLGIQAQYGFIVDKSAACGSGMPCSDHDLELGIQGQYHFAPHQTIDPWVGLGIGYEIESYTTAVLSETYSGTRQGPQLVKLQGGADFQLGRILTVGPFLAFSVAEYATETSEGISNSIPSKALHEWLSVGVKGTFKVGG
jgi:outer membrane protein W